VVDSGLRAGLDDLDGEQSAAAPARHPVVHQLLRAGRIATIVAVVAAVAFAVDREWGPVRDTIRALSWKSLLASLTAVVLGMFATVKVWQHLLAAMGTRIRYRHAAQVNLVGQLGKYLPGSLWAFVLQTQLGKRYEVPRTRALVTLLLSAGVSSVTALSLGALVAEPLSHRWGGAAWLLLAGPLGLLALVPPVLTRIANLALTLLRRPRMAGRIQPGQVLRAVAWSYASWLLFGLQLWVLTGALAKQSWSGYVITTGAFALAMSAGFLAFVLPSGVGAREAVIVAGLAPLASAGPALAIALTSRLLFTIADVSTALAAVGAARFSKHRHGPAHNLDVGDQDRGSQSSTRI
jgi:glycosyltransferase 2 family protein